MNTKVCIPLDLCSGLAGLPPVPITIGEKRIGKKWLDGEGAATSKQSLSVLGITRMHYSIMDQVGAREDFEPSTVPVARRVGYRMGESLTAIYCGICP